MRIYQTQEEVEADIKDGVLDCGGQDVTFECDIATNADIVNAEDIYALNIYAEDIHALDIYARTIDAMNITAKNISYYAVCFAYEDITCTSIRGRRKNSKHFCLDGKITTKEKKTNN